MRRILIVAAVTVTTMLATIQSADACHRRRCRQVEAGCYPQGYVQQAFYSQPVQYAQPTYYAQPMPQAQAPGKSFPAPGKSLPVGQAPDKSLPPGNPVQLPSSPEVGRPGDDRPGRPTQLPAAPEPPGVDRPGDDRPGVGRLGSPGGVGSPGGPGGVGGPDLGRPGPR